uniref:FtsJ domain-containing protein n=1 Tax=Angiostrongylus cantonensis TaxID=6313 RepID=A0A0K0CSX4_ANGCA
MSGGARLVLQGVHNHQGARLYKIDNNDSHKAFERIRAELAPGGVVVTKMFSLDAKVDRKFKSEQMNYDPRLSLKLLRGYTFSHCTHFSDFIE